MKPYWIFSACILMSACVATHHQNDIHSATPSIVEAVPAGPSAAEPTPVNQTASSAPVKNVTPLPPADHSPITTNSAPDPSWSTETGYATY